MTDSQIPNNYFNNSFQKEWSEKRLQFILQLFGEGWFKGKRILEVACGRGFFGKELFKLGADVFFTDARQIFVDQLIADGYTANIMDQDRIWTADEADLIIHFGVLYHLTNWQQDLTCAVHTAPLVLLETETVDIMNNSYQRTVKEEDDYDQAFNGFGTKFSDSHVEWVLTELGCKYTRYDDPLLDVLPTFMYSWKPGELEGPNFHKNTIRRRMWLIESKL